MLSTVLVRKQVSFLRALSLEAFTALSHVRVIISHQLVPPIVSSRASESEI